MTQADAPAGAPLAPLGPRPRVGLGTKVFYGLGSIAFGVKDNGFRVFLLLFYNQVMGVRADLVSLAIMVAMLIDCVIDPVIGEISDNWNSRWGRRHPFMYASALPVALSYLLLWNPPGGWSEMGLFWYLIAVSVIVRSFITLYEVPSSSLSAELTEDYDQRTSILGFRYFFAWWGGLALTVVTFLVFLQPSAKFPVGQLNKDGYAHYGYASAILMFFSILISTAGTHKFVPWLRKPVSLVGRTLSQTVREMKESLSNRSFLVITCVGLFAAVAQGASFSLAFYFSTYFWELSSTWTAVLVCDSFIASGIALFAAPMMSKHSGKKISGSILLGLSVLVGFIPFILRLGGWFPENSDMLADGKTPVIVPWLFIDGVIRGVFAITASILITAMLADVVEDSEVKTGRRSEGLFFAFTSLVQKAVSGVGVMVAGLVLTIVQFPKNAKPGEVDPQIITNLALVYMPVLVVLYGLSLAIMQAYNITREGHANNLRVLAAKAEAAETASSPQFP